jgi:hypothetical protein
MQPCRLLPHPLDDERSFMESSHPPFPFDQQGLVALYALCSRRSFGTPATDSRLPRRAPSPDGAPVHLPWFVMVLRARSWAAAPGFPHRRKIRLEPEQFDQALEVAGEEPPRG